MHGASTRGPRASGVRDSSRSSGAGRSSASARSTRKPSEPCCTSKPSTTSGSSPRTAATKPSSSAASLPNSVTCAPAPRARGWNPTLLLAGLAAACERPACRLGPPLSLLYARGRVPRGPSAISPPLPARHLSTCQAGPPCARNGLRRAPGWGGRARGRRACTSGRPRREGGAPGRSYSSRRRRLLPARALRRRRLRGGCGPGLRLHGSRRLPARLVRLAARSRCMRPGDWRSGGAAAAAAAGAGRVAAGRGPWRALMGTDPAAGGRAAAGGRPSAQRRGPGRAGHGARRIRVMRGVVEERALVILGRRRLERLGAAAPSGGARHATPWRHARARAGVQANSDTEPCSASPGQDAPVAPTARVC
jgi:hypothetical protein